MSLPFAYAASRLTLSQHALPLEGGVNGRPRTSLACSPAQRGDSRSLARTGSQSGTISPKRSECGMNMVTAVRALRALLISEP